MPENAVPESRCGRLGRNDTRGGHRGGAGTPANERERDTLAGPHKSGSAFFVDKSQGGRYARTRRPRAPANEATPAGGRERDGATLRRRQGPRRGLLRPRTSANEPTPDGHANGPTLAEETRANEPGRRRDARERDASRRRPRHPRTRSPGRGLRANETPGARRRPRTRPPANEICARASAPRATTPADPPGRRLRRPGRPAGDRTMAAEEGGRKAGNMSVLCRYTPTAPPPRTAVYTDGNGNPKRRERR